MDGKTYLACLWPGLPDLWYRGRWSALPAALAFAFALNFLLVARFVYPEWLAPLLVRLACWIALGVWGYSVMRAIKQLPTLLHPRAASDAPDRFPEARIHYVQGHWREAEALLTECLGIESRDPPAMLLLAGVYRHTERLAAAENILQELERMEVSAPWWLECQAERARLARFQEAAANREPAEQAETTEAPENVSEPNTEEAVAPAAETAESSQHDRQSADGEPQPDQNPSGEPESKSMAPRSEIAAEAADEWLTAEMTAERAESVPTARSVGW